MTFNKLLEYRDLVIQIYRESHPAYPHWFYEIQETTVPEGFHAKLFDGPWGSRNFATQAKHLVDVLRDAQVVRLRIKHRGTTDKVFRHSQRRRSAGRGIGVQFALVFAVKRMRRTLRRTSTQTTHWKNSVRLAPEDA